MSASNVLAEAMLEAHYTAACEIFLSALKEGGAKLTERDERLSRATFKSGFAAGVLCAEGKSGDAA